jgi:hypothetical protein
VTDVDRAKAMVREAKADKAAALLAWRIARHAASDAADRHDMAHDELCRADRALEAAVAARGDG